MYLRANNSKDLTDIQGNKFYISTGNFASCTGQTYRCTDVDKQLGVNLGLLRPYACKRLRGEIRER